MIYNALPTLIDAPNPPPQINTRRHIVKTPVKRKKRKSYKINNNSLINILKQNLILIAVEEKNTDSLTDTAGEEEEPYANCLNESLKSSSLLLDKDKEILKLKSRIRYQSQQICHLRKSISKLHSKVFRLKRKCKGNSKLNVSPKSNNLSINAKNFMQRQLYQNNKSQGNRYNSKEKMFAMSLWNASPKCYRLLKTTFSLPSISTLHRTIRLIDLKPGFHRCILDSIKQKTLKFTTEQLLVVIAFDEMAIKTKLEYNENLDCILGYEDLGGSDRSNDIGSYITVFMVRSLSGSWKQPVGFFISSGPMASKNIHDKLLECIDHMHECNLITKIVICDQGPSNRGCSTLLNINEKQYFKHKNDIIFFMYDPPHLLKSIRNGLYKDGFNFRGNDVSFKYIKELYYIKKDMNIAIAGKLSDKHVDLNSFSKMRVNLATQVLSQSVASGIRTIAILTKKLSKDSLYTADFCEFFNNLFDIFNSTDLNTSNPYKSVLVPNSISLDFLNNALNILNSITYNGSRYTNSLPCLLGWKCNVIAVLNLFDHLRSHYSISKLYLKNCNQDNVENFFSRMRHGGGNRDNPSVFEFMSEYRKVCIESIFAKIRGSNCSMDAGDFLIKLNQFQSLVHVPINKCTLLTTDDVIPINDVINPLLENNALIALCIDIVVKFCKNFHCSDCFKLICNNVSTEFSSNFLYIMDKSKNINNRISPTNSFIAYIKQLEYYFSKYIYSILHLCNVRQLFKRIITNYDILFIFCKNCNTINPFINDFIINLFVHIRFKSILSKENHDISITFNKKGIRKCRKLLKLKHV